MHVNTKGSRAMVSETRPTAAHAKALSRQVTPLYSNQAMQRFLQRGALQTKLTVNQPGDAFEQEADRMADKVMRMADPASTQPSTHPVRSSAGLQRCSCGSGRAGEECEGCKAQGMRLQRASAVETADTAPPIVHDVLNSPGRTLDAATRRFMEPRFGCDFGGVKIHTGGQAAESAQAIHASAYTVGRNMIFGHGQYVPESSAGRHLIAHELTHVIQQDSLPSLAMASFSSPVLQLKPREPDPATDLKACDKGWIAGTASAWQCGEKKLGTTCEGCGVQLDSWPKTDPCRKTTAEDAPRTCLCKTVLEQVGTQVAAYRDKRCGGKLKVMNRETGDIKTVTVVDAGPYVKDPDDKKNFLRLIDLHQDVFGDSLFHVCVSPYQTEKDDRLHDCWDGFGGQEPKTKPKPKKKPVEKSRRKRAKNKNNRYQQKTHLLVITL
jgi:hypothetical protein